MRDHFYINELNAWDSFILMEMGTTGYKWEQVNLLTEGMHREAHSLLLCLFSSSLWTVHTGQREKDGKDMSRWQKGKAECWRIRRQASSYKDEPSVFTLCFLILRMSSMEGEKKKKAKQKKKKIPKHPKIEQQSTHTPSPSHTQTKQSNWSK